MKLLNTRLMNWKKKWTLLLRLLNVFYWWATLQYHNKKRKRKCFCVTVVLGRYVDLLSDPNSWAPDSRWDHKQPRAVWVALNPADLFRVTLESRISLFLFVFTSSSFFSTTSCLSQAWMQLLGGWENENKNKEKALYRLVFCAAVGLPARFRKKEEGRGFSL